MRERGDAERRNIRLRQRDPSHWDRLEERNDGALGEPGLQLYKVVRNENAACGDIGRGEKGRNRGIV
jgi:hypothetical protein